MKIEFDIFNAEFFRKLTFSLKKAQVSIIYMKIIRCFFYLPVQRELEVLCSKNIIRNYTPTERVILLLITEDKGRE